jgi:hypothetical protein
MKKNKDIFVVPPAWDTIGITLGQTILKTTVPLEIFNIINSIFETQFDTLPDASPILAGKITTEKSLFYNGEQHEKVGGRHNFLPQIVIEYFRRVVEIYLRWNKITVISTDLNSVWVNEMKENEYNPIHVHRGNIYSGLSSVMALKLPNNYGEEANNKNEPINGELELLGNSSGCFSMVDYSPFLKERDFILFPYDIRHTVYPFNGPGIRRTLAANIDIHHNPVASRGTDDRRAIKLK